MHNTPSALQAQVYFSEKSSAHQQLYSYFLSGVMGDFVARYASSSFRLPFAYPNWSDGYLNVSPALHSQ